MKPHSVALSNPLVAAYAPVALRTLLCLALLYVERLEASLIDDGKITFRQVWNFIHGDGMTFNYGERV